jgi:hypothetical protein
MVAKDYRFDVDAEQVWIDTGLDFQKGDRVFVCGGVLDLWRPVTYRHGAFAASVGPGRSAACEAATGGEAGGRESQRGIACHRLSPLSWCQRLALQWKTSGEGARREATMKSSDDCHA